jgi:hypothetical protein
MPASGRERLILRGERYWETVSKLPRKDGIERS